MDRTLVKFLHKNPYFDWKQLKQQVLRISLVLLHRFSTQAPAPQNTALHCTALHCTALHCTALHCTVLYCTALHCTALHCTALYCTALHCAQCPVHSAVLTALIKPGLFWFCLRPTFPPSRPKCQEDNYPTSSHRRMSHGRVTCHTAALHVTRPRYMSHCCVTCHKVALQGLPLM